MDKRRRSNRARKAKVAKSKRAPAGLRRPAKRYERTPKEQAIYDSVIQEQRQKAPSLSFKIREKRGALSVTADHADLATSSILMMEALGTTSGHFMSELLLQICGTLSLTPKDKDESARRFTGAFAMMQGIRPNDETEALLAAQMVAIHNAAMAMASRMNRAQTLDQLNSYSNSLNKLTRTYAAQVEALKRYRSSGEQNIKVQHVTVNDGGQAIVGSVSHQGGGGARKSGGLPHGPSEIGKCCAPVHSDGETLAPALQSPSGEGMDGLPVPRRRRRRATR